MSVHSSSAAWLLALAAPCLQRRGGQRCLEELRGRPAAGDRGAAWCVRAAAGLARCSNLRLLGSRQAGQMPRPALRPVPHARCAQAWRRGGRTRTGRRSWLAWRATPATAAGGRAGKGMGGGQGQRGKVRGHGARGQGLPRTPAQPRPCLPPAAKPALNRSHATRELICKGVPYQATWGDAALISNRRLRCGRCRRRRALSMLLPGAGAAGWGGAHATAALLVVPPAGYNKP